jgi:hypothetical protein
LNPRPPGYEPGEVIPGSRSRGAAGAAGHEVDRRDDPRAARRPLFDDGDIITAAGRSAGIDMALHVVGRLAGPERSRAVREGIEYAPDPPQ